MGGHAFDVKRTSAFLFDPDDLIIIGIDTDDGEEHPLYDERIKAKVPEAMVRNIMVLGVIETISVTKLGDQAIVVDGRQRVRAARLANERLRERGEEEHTVPALIKRGEDDGLMGILISGNEHRLEDTPIARALKAQRLKDRGRNNTEVGMYFGVSSTAIANWLKVLDCIPAVKRAVEQGRISMSAAIELADLDPEAQKKALLEMLEKGQTTVADAKDKRKAAGGGGGGGSRGPGKKLAKKLIKAHEEGDADFATAEFILGVKWAIGEAENSEVDGLEDFIDGSE
jgi:ParB family chromosome partitioning protein